MKKLLLSSMCVLLFIASHVYAQTRTITGTVTEKDDGTPIPGVSIVVKGTKTGTQSNAQGKYTISATSGASLVFTSVGYKPQTVVVTGSTINVGMESSQSQLSDVLVVGYGTQNKRDNVGSVAQIQGSDLVEQPVQNVEQSLAGKAAGVQITIDNSVMNTPPTFHIRGTNSIALSSQPLIVVDGIVSYSGDFSGGESGGNALANINPDDIETIDVLKDASATAIYGSRAANGVVIITTKKGKKGDATVTIDSWMGETKPTRLPKVLNASQYIAEKTEAIFNYYGTNTGTNVPQVVEGTDANGNPINTNWQNIVYRTGTSYNTSASISGGTDKTTYYGSAMFSNQSGIIQKNAFINRGMNFNLDHKATSWLTIGFKLNYSIQDNLAATSSGSLSGEAYATAGLGRLALLLPPNLQAYNNQGGYNLNPSTGAIGTGLDQNISISYTNPVVALSLDRANNEINHLAATLYAQVKPLPWIALRTQYGLDYLYSTNDAFSDPVDNFSSSGGVITNNASATDTYSANKRWVWDNTLQIDKSFGKHTFGLLLGNEQQYSTSTGFGLGRTTLSDPAFNVIQAGFVTPSTAGLSLSQNYLVSFFGRFNYNFDEKYFVSATLRRDGYSGFGFNSKYGYFPSVGGGWEITKEDFWKNVSLDKVFSSFKLKGSWGRVGNNGVSDFGSYTTYGNSLYNGNATLVPSATGNNSLAWESVSKTDFGFDYGLFNDRITGSVALYYDNTSGGIFNYTTAPSAGLASAPPVNIYSMWNKGIEFDLNADIIRKGAFRWNANFNIAYDHNKITSLLPGVSQLTYSTSSLETTNINQVGYAVGDLWIIKSAGVDPNNGDRIFLNAQGHKVEYTYTGTQHWYNLDGTPYVAASGTGINQNADATNYANGVPKVIGGMTNSFHYKNFDLSVLFTYQLGFDVYYGTQATLTDQRFWNNSTLILNHWTTPGQNAAYPKVVFGDNVSNGTSFPTDFNTYNGDFLKVKTVNLGYTLPKPLLAKAGVKSVRVYVSSQNLLIITKYPGPDPEVGSNGTSNSSPGVDRNTVGNGRTFTAGFSFKF